MSFNLKCDSRYYLLNFFFSFWCELYNFGSFLLPFYRVFVCVCLSSVCLSICMHTCHNAHGNITEQLGGVSPLFMLYESRALNALQLVDLPVEPSCHYLYRYLNIYNYATGLLIYFYINISTITTGHSNILFEREAHEFDCVSLGVRMHYGC